MLVNQHCRVIMLLDLDCFYAQVEQKRCGIPRDVPVAVQQWEGLIAINYAARAKGITRHMRAPEAKLRCPELQCIHVETIGGSGDGAAAAECKQAPANASASNAEDHEAPGGSRLTHKACLERYRKASVEIMSLLRKLTPGAPVEKASIDEVYIDVTSMVEAELRSLGGGEAPRPASPGVCAPGSAAAAAGFDSTSAFGWGGIVVDGPLRVDSEFERRLSVGAMIACRLRGAVREQLGYTMSAGIACNKLLAKVAAGLHKPDQQTIVPPRAAEGLLADMPLGKIRNFGGKLGAELQSMGCTTPGQVAKLPLRTLEECFGDRASWILDAVRGISDEPVQEKELPKSMLAAKSFNATSDWRQLQRWLAILAEELAARMADDAAQHRRHPRTLVLHYRASGSGPTTAAGRSRSCPMPYFGRQKPYAEIIAASALKLAQAAPDLLPCFNLAISATEFAAAPVAQHKSIERFFGVAAASAAKPSASDTQAAASGGATEAATGTASQGEGQAEPQHRAGGSSGTSVGSAQRQQQQQQQQQQRRGAGSRRGPSQPPTIETLFSRAAQDTRSTQHPGSNFGDGGGAGSGGCVSAAVQQAGVGQQAQQDQQPQPAAESAQAQRAAQLGKAAAQPWPPPLRHPQSSGDAAAAPHADAGGAAALQLPLQVPPVRTAPERQPPAAPAAMSERQRSAGNSPVISGPFAASPISCSPFGASPTPATSPAGGSAFGSPLARSSSPFADAAAAPLDDSDQDEAADAGPRQRVQLGTSRRRRQSPLSHSGSPLASSAAKSDHSGLASTTSSPLGDRRRSGQPRRSPTAAVVAARRDVFAGACDAAVAACSSPDSAGGSPAAMAQPAASAQPAVKSCSSPDAAAAPVTEPRPRTAQPESGPPVPPAACPSDGGPQQQSLQPQSPGESAFDQTVEDQSAAADQPAAAAMGGSNAAQNGASSPDAAEPVVLEEVDVAEQRRILQDIAVRQRLEAGRTQQPQGRKRGSGAGAGGAKRGRGVPTGQAQLLNFFSKQ